MSKLLRKTIENQIELNTIIEQQKEIERLKKDLEQQKLHNTHLEQEMIHIAELLGNKEQAITFTDIKIEIEKLKAEINLLDNNRIHLNNRIDEAVEYITEEITKGTDVYCEEKVDGIIVLEILKGE